MPAEEPGSKTAKVMYRPVGMIGGIVAGIVAGQIFKQVWKRVSRGDDADAPKALESEYDVKEIFVAAPSRVRSSPWSRPRSTVAARAPSSAGPGKWPGD